MTNILSNLASGTSDFLTRFGTELGAPGTLARLNSAAELEEAQELKEGKQIGQRRRLGSILSGQSTPAFLRPGGAEGLTAEQSKQLQLNELAGLGTEESLDILKEQSPLAQKALTPFQQKTLDLQSKQLDVNERKTDVELRDIKRKEKNATVKQALLERFTGQPQQQKQVENATKPIKATNNIGNLLDDASKKVDDAAQIAAITGDKSILDAAKARYDVAKDRYDRRTGKDIKDFEYKAAGFFDRMNAAEGRVSSIGPAGLPTIDLALITGVAGDTLANFAATPEQQQFIQSTNDWIRAKLRKESGAVIGDDEARREYSTYFPVVGDSPQAVEMKAEARKIATNNMQRAGGRALRLDGPVAEPTTPDQDLSGLSDDDLLKIVRGQ